MCTFALDVPLPDFHYFPVIDRHCLVFLKHICGFNLPELVDLFLQSNITVSEARCSFGYTIWSGTYRSIHWSTQFGLNSIRAMLSLSHLDRYQGFRWILPYQQSNFMSSRLTPSKWWYPEMSSTLAMWVFLILMVSLVYTQGSFTQSVSSPVSAKRLITEVSMVLLHFSSVVRLKLCFLPVALSCLAKVVVQNVLVEPLSYSAYVFTDTFSPWALTLTGTMGSTHLPAPVTHFLTNSFWTCWTSSFWVSTRACVEKFKVKKFGVFSLASLNWASSIQSAKPTGVARLQAVET